MAEQGAGRPDVRGPRWRKPYVLSSLTRGRAALEAPQGGVGWEGQGRGPGWAWKTRSCSLLLRCRGPPSRDGGARRPPLGSPGTGPESATDLPDRATFTFLLTKGMLTTSASG